MNDKANLDEKEEEELISERKRKNREIYCK